MSLRTTLLPDQSPIWPYRTARGEAAQVTALRHYVNRRRRVIDRNLRPYTAGERMLVPVGAALWPLNAAARAWRIAGQLATAPSADGRVPARLGTARTLWGIAMRENLPPADAARFGLHLAGRAGEARMFVTDVELVLAARDACATIDPALLHTINDKLEFSRLCRRLGLPTVPVLAWTTNGAPLVWDEAQAFPHADVVVKVNNGAFGNGLQMAAWDPGREVHRIGERTFTPDELQAWLPTGSQDNTLLVQPRLVNHPAIQPFAGRALSTLRIVTTQDAHGVPRVSCAAMRMGVGRAVVDNISAGGLSAHLDVASGTLRAPATGMDASTGTYARHPDSGAAIDGFVVPFWAEAQDLALRLHAAIGTFSSVGWDVAVTADGPLLVEGNIIWSADLVQTAGWLPLGRTPVVAALTRALRLPAPGV